MNVGATTTQPVSDVLFIQAQWSNCLHKDNPPGAQTQTRASLAEGGEQLRTQSIQ